MVDLTYSDLTFCQCFLRSETKKFMAKWMFWTNCSSVMPTLPTATLKHKTWKKNYLAKIVCIEKDNVCIEKDNCSIKIINV